MSDLKNLKALDEIERKIQKIEVLMMAGKVIDAWRSTRSLLTEIAAAKKQEYTSLSQEEEENEV